MPALWRSSPVTPDWLLPSVSSLGWNFDQTQLGERDLTIADAADTAVKPPRIGIQGFPGANRLPHLGYARMPVDAHFFSDDGLWLYVEVSDVTDSWARTWANFILGLGPAKEVPAGRGYAVVKGAVIDTGSRLIRATWGSASDPGLGTEKRSPVKYEEQILALRPQRG